MHAIVYTAILGGHDTLKEPIAQDVPCEFICFTEGKMPSRVGAWRVINVKPDANYPRLQSRRFKLLSHRIFPRGRLAWRYAPMSRRRRGDLLIWVDGSIQIKNPSFVRDMRAVLGEDDWAMFAHPDRDCIYDEAQLISTMAKHRGLPVLSQAKAYESVVPVHGGLYAATMIVRRGQASGRIKRANELWWRELQKWTNRDQVSLPYILRIVEKCDPLHIPGQLRSNKWFNIVPHSRNT